MFPQPLAVVVVNVVVNVALMSLLVMPYTQ